MSKWYEVKVTTVMIYAVEVRDGEAENEAISDALDDWTSRGSSEAEAAPVPSSHLATIRRHADHVISLEPESTGEDDD